MYIPQLVNIRVKRKGARKKKKKNDKQSSQSRRKNCRCVPFRFQQFPPPPPHPHTSGHAWVERVGTFRPWWRASSACFGVPGDEGCGAMPVQRRVRFALHGAQVERTAAAACDGASLFFLFSDVPPVPAFATPLLAFVPAPLHVRLGIAQLPNVILATVQEGTAPTSRLKGAHFAPTLTVSPAAVELPATASTGAYRHGVRVLFFLSQDKLPLRGRRQAGRDTHNLLPSYSIHIIPYILATRTSEIELRAAPSLRCPLA